MKHLVLFLALASCGPSQAERDQAAELERSAQAIQDILPFTEAALRESQILAAESAGWYETQTRYRRLTMCLDEPGVDGPFCRRVFPDGGR